MRAAVLLVLLPAAALASGFQWDVPDLIEQTEVPGQVQAAGVPVKIRAAVSKRSAQELLDYYSTAFIKAGLWLPPGNRQYQGSKYPQLTAIDPATKISYSVILQPNADGSTTVIMGTADVSQYPNAAAPDDFAPLFPGAQHVTRTRSEIEQTILFSTTAKAEEVESFYAKTLAGDGYRPDKTGTLVGPKGWVRVAVQEKDGKRWVVLTHGTGTPGR